MKNIKAMTLIEVIIVMGILGIVLAAISSVFGFGNNAFIIGSNQYDIQSDIRLLTSYIEHEIKYASYVEINPESIPTNITDSYEYIYLDSDPENNVIIHKSKNGTKVFDIGDEISISFIKKGPSSKEKELSYVINSKLGNQKYNISSDVSILNLRFGPTGYAGDRIVESEGSIVAVKYNKTIFNISNTGTLINSKPYAENLKIVYRSDIGTRGALIASYDYQDLDGDPQDPVSTIITWEYEQNNGTWKTLSGEDSLTYLFKNESEKSTNFRFTVKPFAETGVYEGNIRISDPFKVN